RIEHGGFSVIWRTTDRGTAARRIVMATDSTTPRDSFACDEGAPMLADADRRLGLVFGIGSNVNTPSSMITNVQRDMALHQFAFKQNVGTVSGPASEDWPQTQSWYASGSMAVRFPLRGIIEGELRLEVGTPEQVKSYYSAL